MAGHERFHTMLPDTLAPVPCFTRSKANPTRDATAPATGQPGLLEGLRRVGEPLKAGGVEKHFKMAVGGRRLLSEKSFFIWLKLFHL